MYQRCSSYCIGQISVVGTKRRGAVVGGALWRSPTEPAACRLCTRVDDLDGGYPIRFAVRSLGWVEMNDDELSAEHSGKAVNRCIVGLSVGKNDVNDVVGRWGDVSTVVRVQTPGYVPKKTRWVFFGYTHLKNPPPKNPHFYFNLILVCTLYATNNAIFYCF